MLHTLALWGLVTNYGEAEGSVYYISLSFKTYINSVIYRFAQPVHRLNICRLYSQEGYVRKVMCALCVICILWTVCCNIMNYCNKYVFVLPKKKWWLDTHTQSMVVFKVYTS